MKKYTILAFIAIFVGSIGIVSAQSIPQINPWKTLSGVISPVTSTNSLKVPQLGGSGTKCLHVDNTGLFSTATADCGTGGSSSIDQLGQIGDVSTTTLAWGSVIRYNTATGKWESVATSTLGLGGSSGTVSSVDMTVPTGLTVAGNPITGAGTLALTYTTGYSIPTTLKQTSWDNKWDLASSTIGIAYGGTGLTTIGASSTVLTTNGTVAKWNKLATSQLTNDSGFVTSSGVTSIATTWPIIGGTITTTGTLTFGGLSTSTAAVVGNIPYFSGANTFANVATGTISASLPISVTAGRYCIGGNCVFSIADAVADASTKGASTYTANDFNSSSGTISLDYANGQEATSGQDGFLSSTNWSTFNAKESALTFNYPLTRATNAISSALSTTTTNIWSALNTFANASTTLLSASYASSTSLYVGNRNILGTFDKSANIASTTLDNLGKSFATASTTLNLWNPSVAVGTTALYCKTTNGTVTVEMGNGTASTTAVCTTSGTSVTSSLTWTARADVKVVIKDTSASAASRVTITPTYYNQ